MIPFWRLQPDTVAGQPLVVFTVNEVIRCKKNTPERPRGKIYKQQKVVGMYHRKYRRKYHRKYRVWSRHVGAESQKTL